MTKRATKKKVAKPDDVRRLKYNGKDGKPFITSPVLVPARDLEYYDLANLATEMGCAIGEVVDLLTDGSPGRQSWDKRPLYEASEPWSCEICKKKFQDWTDYHEHMLGHEEKPEDK